MVTKTKLNDDQKEAFRAIQKFIDHPVADTFVLKGYAGTGKTFLMQWLAKWLEEKDYKFSLLASTGRAATVLRGKTGLTTKTVHSELYHFNKVDGADEELPANAGPDQHGQMTLLFSLREPDRARRIYIVDESSMLANELPADLSTVSFGSGFLLDDFFSAVGNNKIVFVGDPGQLPPVKQVFSPALEMNWLASQNRVAITATLEKMERNESDNDILLFATAIRNMADDKSLPAYPLLPASGKNNIKIYESDRELFENYVNQFNKKGPDNTIAIARSNRMVNDINRAVRRDLFESADLPIQNDDVILVTHNNYAFPLANGDFVVVLEVKEIKTLAGLRFQKILTRAILSNAEYELLISLDILYGREVNFSKIELKILMLDFNDRMKEKKIKLNSEKYKEAMLTDPYLNCLRAKFGYAVTCHKAQGGEWNDVYLFLEKSMYAMPKTELIRWWYTAVTRAKQNLHLANNWWIR
jgi:ATP-dependent exoDNAse (exonuclease V) alpha subunit